MDDINQIIANLTPQDMEMLRGVAASILGDGGQGSAPGAASPPGAQPTPQPKPGSANSAVQQLTDTVAGEYAKSAVRVGGTELWQGGL